MATCRYEQKVARWFDGEPVDENRVRTHLDACGHCRSYLVDLERLHTGAKQAAADIQMTEAQLDRFLHELEQGLHRKRPRRVGLWAMASVAAAAIVVALSVLSIFSTGPKPIEATVIEEAHTEIDGATTESFVSDDGTATIWVNVPEGDLW